MLPCCGTAVYIELVPGTSDACECGGSCEVARYKEATSITDGRGSTKSQLLLNGTYTAFLFLLLVLVSYWYRTTYQCYSSTPPKQERV